MAASVNFPITTTALLLNTRIQPKIVFLPAASTIAAGRLLYISDICGNAGVSSIYISTVGRDSFDGRHFTSTVYGLMSTNFQSLTLASDGLLNWMILQNYTANVIAKQTQALQGLTQTFSYTGLAQTFSVPQTSTQIIVYVWGAGGGGGGATDAGAYSAGSGAFVSGTLNVTPGETLTIIVGLGGTINQLTAGTLVQGGGGGAGNPTNGCGSGGGRSAIQRPAGTDIVVAGAGSGGGWRQGAAATWFGISNPGTSVNGANGGGAGTQTAGGAAGVVSGYAASTAGSKGQGGNGGGYASGGGGGWYGGGGGGVTGGNGGTGGAGSSYIDLLISPSGVSGGVPTAPATTSPYYGGGAAVGGQSGATTGGNGRVVIVY